MTGWLPAYPQIDGTIGAEWIPLVTSGGVSDPRSLHYKARFQGTMQPTAALLGSPRLLNIWSALSIPYENSKLVKIAPGGIIPRHRCHEVYWRNLVRVIVVIQSDNAVFSWQGVDENFGEGSVYVVQHGQFHEIRNEGTQDCYFVFLDVNATEVPRVLTL